VARVEGDTELQSDVLEDLKTATNYRKWLCSLALPYFGDDVLEVGSGLGYYASDWADMGVSLTTSEADQGRLAALRARFAEDPRVSVRELSVPITEEANYSSVVAYNVLEHIPDHVEALRAFRGLLRESGAVIIVVPAFEKAMSRFDLAIGHQRRYTKASLSAALGQAGLHVERCHYVNAPGLLAWYVGMKLLGGKPKEGPLLTIWDKVVVPVERRIEQRLRMPFGQSVFAVAHR
jgi:2-polyprenyl-3-methyl-5-hydroxy-6-metoxy-1,4-benzoquinol methylase